MSVDSNPTVPAAALEVAPATPFVAFMRSAPMRAAVTLASAVATPAAAWVACTSTQPANVPMATVMGALIIPLASGFLPVGMSNRKLGDLFPENKFYFFHKQTAVGTLVLSTLFATLTGGMTSIIEKARVSDEAREAAAIELSREALVPAANLCGNQITGHVYTMLKGKEHRVSCAAK